MSGGEESSEELEGKMCAAQERENERLDGPVEGAITGVEKGSGDSQKRRKHNWKSVTSAADLNLGEWRSRMTWGSKITTWREDKKRPGLIYGRFTAAEDNVLREAVKLYREQHGLGEDRLNDLLYKVTKNADLKGCWLEIAKCLPQRTVRLIRARALRLLDKTSNLGPFTESEDKKLRRLVGKYGRKWKKLQKKMGRYAGDLADRWQVIEGKDRHNAGKWSQDELERLSALVHKDLFLQARMQTMGYKTHPKWADGGDGISWTHIAKQLGTRNYLQCLQTWHLVLAPAMFGDEKWTVGDDHHLLRGLMQSEADGEDEVDWDKLIPERDGIVCRTRWRRILKHLPQGFWSFEEKLVIATRRFAPQLMEEEDSMAQKLGLAHEGRLELSTPPPWCVREGEEKMEKCEERVEIEAREQEEGKIVEENEVTKNRGKRKRLKKGGGEFVQESRVLESKEGEVGGEDVGGTLGEVREKSVGQEGKKMKKGKNRKEGMERVRDEVRVPRTKSIKDEEVDIRLDGG
eukprot:TRINITY_DN5284_c0_g1_i5.p1 TRINITY_DN5284_c0_g1~~TRINITY_DN5284_c0_g1_i5.p1  ORF type:complete len:580 (-),score=133.03 TRINITY_DN5284_c0_g1_i5:41-1594(-)